MNLAIVFVVIEYFSLASFRAISYTKLEAGGFNLQRTERSDNHKYSIYNLQFSILCGAGLVTFTY